VASLGGRGGKKVTSDTVLYAFDLLYLDGHDISMLSLEGRRMLLDPLLSNASGAILLSEMFETDGASLVASVAELGVEGIVAKRLDTTYRSGRGGEWRKIKCVRADTFVVIGYRKQLDAIATQRPTVLSGEVVRLRRTYHCRRNRIPGSDRRRKTTASLVQRLARCRGQRGRLHDRRVASLQTDILHMVLPA
jgi:hypothetical protein